MECDSSALVCELGRIADALSGFDFDGLVNTFIATIAGAFVAAGVTLWVNGRERPRPHWNVTTTAPAGHWMVDNDGKGYAIVRATNIGDGPAYNVRLATSGNDLPTNQAVVSPGESVAIRMAVEAGGSIEWDINTGKSDDQRRYIWPAGARAFLEWQEPPRRSHIRHLTSHLSDPLSGL